MSVYSSEVPVGAVVTFTFPQPFIKGRGDQPFKVVDREKATPTTRETVVACDQNGHAVVGAREHKVVLEFVEPVGAL